MHFSYLFSYLSNKVLLFLVHQEGLNSASRSSEFALLESAPESGLKIRSNWKMFLCWSVVCCSPFSWSAACSGRHCVCFWGSEERWPLHVLWLHVAEVLRRERLHPLHPFPRLQWVACTASTGYSGGGKKEIESKIIIGFKVISLFCLSSLSRGVRHRARSAVLPPCLLHPLCQTHQPERLPENPVPRRVSTHFLRVFLTPPCPHYHKQMCWSDVL